MSVITIWNQFAVLCADCQWNSNKLKLFLDSFHTKIINFTPAFITMPQINPSVHHVVPTRLELNARETTESWNNFFRTNGQQLLRSPQSRSLSFARQTTWQHNGNLIKISRKSVVSLGKASQDVACVKCGRERGKWTKPQIEIIGTEWRCYHMLSSERITPGFASFGWLPRVRKREVMDLIFCLLTAQSETERIT